MSVSQRAYALLTVKSVDDDERVITGIASTPTPDRVGDVMEPKGAQFTLPLPLLWQHNQHQPIGEVFWAKATATGIEIKARFAKIADEGALKTRLDEAWQSVKHKLVKGLSIGFRGVESARIENTWGRHYTKWDWLELSAVTIPANAQATIQTVKQFDINRPAASGTGRDVSTRRVRPLAKSEGAMSTTYNEQIDEQRTLLTEKTTRLEELMQKDADEGGLEADEQKELDQIEPEIEAITKRIKRLSALEGAASATAKTVAFSTGVSKSTPAMRVEVKDAAKELPKGALFTRYAMAVAAGKGSMSDTMAFAKRFSNTPEVAKMVNVFWGQKAVEGTALPQSPGWGSELAVANTAMTEFVELLMPQTIIGRVNGFRRVPFNIPIITQTGGSTFAWVDEGNPKPVGELEFDRSSLGFSKAAGIVVMTEELVRLSNPSAENLARQDLIDQCVKFLDEQFIRVNVTAGAQSPASITNSVASPTATGQDAAALKRDLMIAMQTFTAAKIPLTGLAIVTTPDLALGISLLTNELGQAPAGFNVTPSGGTLLGYPVIVSESVDAGHVIVFKPSEIFLADDGQVRLDASNQATIDMAGGGTATFNLWQRNCVGLRAERWINWKKRRDNVVAVIDTASYGPSVGSP